MFEGPVQDLIDELGKLPGIGPKSANLVLAPGDIVSVEETPLTLVVQTFTNIVRITAGSSVALF